jgi:ribosome biogenesis GTPase A
MGIQWYPGHMHKATKAMIELLPQVDIIIELVDARAPYSSSNPVIEKIAKEKERIKILNKNDLADPNITALWHKVFNNTDGVRTLACGLRTKDQISQIIDLCCSLSANKIGRSKLVLVVGIPNVGKSTLINAMAGRRVALTGNEPAVTKGHQRVNLRNGIMLVDTPGILWGKVENESSSFRLAVTGAIKNTAMTYEEVAIFAAKYLMDNYPKHLKQRFILGDMPVTELDLLDQIGVRRGCLRAGGKIDRERAATIFINELRSGALGKISFETPDSIVQELCHLTTPTTEVKGALE